MNANNLHVVQRQVPIGGAYRLIDVPMSNCINSGINKVYILTQFNSASLNRHLARAYSFGRGPLSYICPFTSDYLKIVDATIQSPQIQGKEDGGQVIKKPESL